MSDTLPAVASIPAPRSPDCLVQPPAGAAVFPLARHVQAQIDEGVHPATRAPIQPDTSCGTCAHATAKSLDDGTSRTRCTLSVSRRGGPDILPGFPGCDHHTARQEPTR